MNAEEARKRALKVNEDQKKIYDEYERSQFQRVKKMINESAETGNCSITLSYEQIQPQVQNWLLDNGYIIEDNSTEEDYYFDIKW